MQEELKGTVERITYYSEEDGYTVARFQPEGRGDLVTVVGNLMSVNVGASLRLEGFWTTHAKHGRQFKVINYQTVLPATVEGIRKYLGSGLIKGIGPVTAKRIVKHFGLDTLDIIEHHPRRLREVLGVGKKRVEMVMQAWEEQRSIKEVMLFLQSHDVSTSLAVKIYKQYEDAALDVVQEDPYRLARDIYGIGFLTADKIARKMGLPTDSPQRVAAGISYVLGQLADEGNVYAPQGRLIKEATEILDVSPDLVEEGVVQLEEEEQIHREDIAYNIQDQPGVAVREEKAVYLLPFYYGEVGVANRLRTLINVGRSRLAFYQTANWERVFAHLAERASQPLNARQQEAVRMALTNKVTVLTGGPGTGKTTTVRTIIRLLEARSRSYVLASPTGRAAKRLSEATGREAKTVHRLLEFSPQQGFRFQRNEDHPLEADMVIVDEASMLDLLLTNHLLKAIDPASHLLLVGDVDQLPSVGAGNVLKDIIASGQAAVVRLEDIFRQAEGSLIVANAHRINRGQMPLFTKGATDFFLFVEEDPEKAADLVVDLVKTRIPRKFGYHPFDDIQVLSPMYRGAVGVSNLNVRLQEALNPPSLAKGERRLAGRLFRLGDKVMQTRNNYDKEVYNGDIGRVVRLDLENQIMVVRIDDRPVPYDFSDLDELVHAFAVSVHKCVADDTYLFTERGLQPVRALWPDRGGFRFRPLSLAVMGKDGWAQAGQIYDGGEAPVITVKTRFGYTLTGSHRHPILVYEPKSCQFVWRKLPELKIGDWIPIQRAQTAFPGLPLPTSHFDMVDQSHGLRNPCRIPPMVDADLGALLGYLVGDGSYTYRKDGDIRFTNSDSQLLNHVRQLVRSLFGLEMTLNQSRVGRAAPSYYVINRTLRDFLYYLGLDYRAARDKEVPWAILCAPCDTQAAFLRALFDCDGSASGNSTRVVLSTASERLAEQVQLMLLNFGIVSKRTAQLIETKSGKKPYYRVAFFGLNVVLFAQEIGFTQHHKVEQLANSVRRSQNRAGKTNVDFIPGGQRLMSELRAAVLERLPEHTQGRKGCGFWGRLPYNVARTLCDLSRGQFRLTYHHLAKILPVLRREWPDLTGSPVYQKAAAIQQSHYFFEPVESITEGKAHVYDLTVPGAENFTTNGFISHNSQGSEYTAVVMPVLTQHYLMLQRNLLYTGMTRAEKLVVLVGTRKAIAIAVRNDKIAHRHTALGVRLREARMTTNRAD